MFNPYQPSFPMPQQYQPQSQGLQFVNGIESAQLYQLPPNSKQILMDKELARFYLVETDASGQKSVKAYDFAEAKPQATQYVTVEQFEEVKQGYESLTQQLKQLIQQTNKPDAVNAVHAANRPAASTETNTADARQRANHARPTLPSI